MPPDTTENLTLVLPEGLEADLAIEAGDWPQEAQLEQIVRRAIAAAFEMATLQITDICEVSFLFTDDAAIRDLNLKWRQKDKATNVLSFPGSDPDDDVYGPHLGDVAIAFETVAREAKEIGIEFSDHLTHLLVHGLLHLFGYDHTNPEEAELMESLEITILSSLGIGNPYLDSPLVVEGQ